MVSGNCKSNKVLFSYNKQVTKSPSIVSITELLFFSLRELMKFRRRSTFDNEKHKQMVPEPEQGDSPRTLPVGTDFHMY